MLSDSYYAKSYDSPSSPSSSPSSPLSPASISSALRLFPTIIFFHGNAGTRAVSFRIQTYKGFASRLNSNVLVVDYRGFADSEGTPSESGLNLDAHAAWDWAVQNGADAADLILVGQSLGTAVATGLARDLSNEGAYILSYCMRFSARAFLFRYANERTGFIGSVFVASSTLGNI